ncbi:hypothetical protein V5F89_13250 [Pelagerythrobacter marensis]|uniref:Uncharacterized protein n=1 Tax=Pelagerythrobacter marensis TaxID=543877 RepID=A0ABZ2D2G3_9SPHN
MEYEIADDPQGERDRCEADRTGGLREDHLLRGHRQAAAQANRILAPKDLATTSSRTA